MIVLPSAYLPSVEYFVHLLSGGDVVIDCGEHYIKRSLRNRTEIMTAQGRMTLTIPICNANRPRTKMTTVEIDNSKRWQHQHWIAILSAYRSSPYYDHYAPFIEPIFTREWHSLVELNKVLLEVVLKLLKMGNRSPQIDSVKSPRYVDSYYECCEGDVDLRPKGALEQGLFTAQYTQVFSDRVEFIPNLSILDLLFCEGPNALRLLQR